MAEMMFYEKLNSLDSKLHAGLRLKTGTGFQYAAKTNSVPIVSVEFVDIARDYPIVFVKGSDDNYLPVALLGLRENENLQVGENGQWEGRYVPAFVRRYPFVPAEIKEGEIVVCIDEAAAGLNMEEGELIFEGDQPAPLLQSMIQLLQDYQGQAMRTTEFSQRLQDNNLLIESNAEVKTPDGGNLRLGGMFVVDEKRLQVLDKDKVHALFSSGELGLIFAHLMSLGNLQSLVGKLSARLQAEPSRG